ncbi:cellulose biosynthesis protein BcsN [Sinorhizobium meliloti]|uniref:cellulose biosynthesis protein BcsN n=1 Tax=Rhizobium meliloti TaxID=382 RepID=UPI001F47A6C6|nr:cellulose biosynthesis protein BcsN [Sinorhizobium meliloti]
MPTAAAMVPPESALVLPPPGGPAVLSVVERRTSNAVEQDINLHTSAATPGQNVLRVQFFGPVGASNAQERTAYVPIRSSEMMREAHRAIPGAALRQTADYLQNNYGPFSYAFGRGQGDDSCLYAWQQIRPPQHRRSPLRDYGTIQIRLRYCKTGATQSELLAAVYGYTILGTFADPDWNPYGEPPAVDPALGRAGNPIYKQERPLAAAGSPIQPVRAVRSAPEPEEVDQTGAATADGGPCRNRGSCSQRFAPNTSAGPVRQQRDCRSYAGLWSAAGK